MVHLLTFTPIFKERIWGGRNLEKLFGKPLPANLPIGESWELVDLPTDQSVVNIGPAAGKTLAQLVREWSGELLGNARLDGGQFPLLIKLLDANDILSVQVHPDYEAAEKMGLSVRAKYEAWYIVDAEEGSYIYAGLKPGTTSEQVHNAVREGTLAHLLVKKIAKKGDCFYLPGGTVHAIGSGLVIAEVQTPSDTTFRLYDWNRIDLKTGCPRDLHVEDALRCIRVNSEPSASPLPPDVLACAPTFCIYRREAKSGARLTVHTGQPLVWIVIQGTGHLADPTVTIDLQPGKTILIPAGVKTAAADFTSQTTYLEVKLS